MYGMSATTGKPLESIAHLKQSITDILTTPLGSRIMRREYGSRLFELIDNPTSAEFAMELYAAIAEALEKWETRFKLEQVKVIGVVEGKVTVSLKGTYVPTGLPLRLDGIVL